MLASREDPAAFASIFDRHAPAVLRFLERRVGPGLAEDLLSEVFRIAFECRTSFDPTRPDAAPWLYGIGANVVRRHWRSQQRRLRAVARVATTSVALNDEGTDDPTDAMDARRQLPLVVDVIDELEAADREVLLLAAFERLPQAEIAAALSIPVGTVKSRLNRARRVLRERTETR